MSAASTRLALRALAALALSSSGCREAPAASPPIRHATVEAPAATPPSARFSSGAATVIFEGLSGPECVIHDEEADVYLVSNIHGEPTAEDDDGFIARVSPTGKILHLKWIDGASPDVTLHAPKGMALRGDTLYVADVGAVRLFDRATGAPKGEWKVEGSTFLNDVAVDEDGRVLVTDTAVRITPQGPVEEGTDRIHLFAPEGTRTTLAERDALDGPNGVLWSEAGPLYVSFLGADLSLLTGGGSDPIARLPRDRLDGLVRLPDGSFLVSSWSAEGVYHVRAGGEVDLVLQGLKTPAAIGYDEKRAQILVPLLSLNQVRLERFDPSGRAEARR